MPLFAARLLLSSPLAAASPPLLECMQYSEQRTPSQRQPTQRPGQRTCTRHHAVITCKHHPRGGCAPIAEGSGRRVHARSCSDAPRGGGAAADALQRRSGAHQPRAGAGDGRTWSVSQWCGLLISWAPFALTPRRRAGSAKVASAHAKRRNVSPNTRRPRRGLRRPGRDRDTQPA